MSSDSECEDIFLPDQVYADVKTATAVVVEELNKHYAFVEDGSDNWIVEDNAVNPQTGFLFSRKTTIAAFRQRIKVNLSCF